MTPLDVVTQISFEPIPTAFIAVTTLCYLWLVRRLGAKGRRWPGARTASWLVGEFFLALGLLSGIAAHDEMFTIHTVQHILIGMVAPLFFALSAPMTLLLQASSRRVQTGLLKILHSAVFKVFAHPITAWALYGTALFALYFTSLYAITLENDTVHNFVHVGLILAGCMFWWPVVGLDPMPFRLNYAAKMAYLFLAMPFHTILGLALQSQTTPIAPGTSLAALHAGGGLMWVSGEAVGLIGVVVVFVQWLRADERQAKREDRMNEAAAAAQLAHWRATREAAARAISQS
jgi:putative copper resistance protein D